jgi:hypothetical protein
VKHAEWLDNLFDGDKSFPPSISDLKKGLEEEKTQRVTFTQSDIRILYNRIQDVRDKTGSEKLSVKEPSLLSRILNLEEANNRRKKDIADTITTLSSSMTEITKLRESVPSITELPNAAEVSRLVKREIELELEKQKELTIELTSNVKLELTEKLNQAVNGAGGDAAVNSEIKSKLQTLDMKLQELGTILSGGSSGISDSNCILSQLKDLTTRIEETENTLDDGDPSSLFSLVTRHDEWIGDSRGKLNTLHEDIVSLHGQATDFIPLEERVRNLETFVAGTEPRNARDASVSSAGSGSSPNVLDHLPTAQTVKEVKNTVRKLEEVSNRTSSGLMAIQKQQEGEVEARQKLYAESGERLLRIEGLATNLSTMIQLQERTVAEEVSAVQKRVDNLEGILRNADNAKSALAQPTHTKPTQAQILPPATLLMSQPVANTFQKVDTRLWRLEEAQRAFPVEKLNQNLNVCSAAIGALETRFQNLMTTDLANRILHQLHEQLLAVEPAHLAGKVQQMEHSLVTLSQQIRGLDARNGANRTPELHAEMQNRLANNEARSGIPLPAGLEGDQLVEGVGGAGGENGSTTPMQALTHRLTQLESRVNMILSQLKLEAHFQADGSIAESTPSLRDLIEEDIIKIVRDLTTLKTNVNSINDILVTTTADINDVKRDVERTEKKADNISHTTSTIKRTMVKKSHFEDLRTSIGLGSAVTTKVTNGASVASRDSDPDYDSEEPQEVRRQSDS